MEGSSGTVTHFERKSSRTTGVQGRRLGLTIQRKENRVPKHEVLFLPEEWINGSTLRTEKDGNGEEPSREAWFGRSQRGSEALCPELSPNLTASAAKRERFALVGSRCGDSEWARMKRLQWN